MTATLIRRAAIGLPASGASRRPLSEVAGLTVHHTTGATLAEQAAHGRDAVDRWVRNLYAFHTDDWLPRFGNLPAVTPWAGAHDWADLGYHRLVHLPLRLVFEGRPLDRIGAHARGPANRHRIGLAVLGGDLQGDADDLAFLAGEVEAIRREIAPAAWTVDGHRDWGATSCPGPWLYNHLNEIATPPPTNGRPVTEAQTARIIAHLATIAADTERTRRLTEAIVARAVAALRADLDGPAEPESDDVWPPRIGEGSHTIGDAAQAIAAKRSA